MLTAVTILTLTNRLKYFTAMPNMLSVKAINKLDMRVFRRPTSGDRQSKSLAAILTCTVFDLDVQWLLPNHSGRRVVVEKASDSSVANWQGRRAERSCF